ncbi:MAG TPA: hypothetical protein VGE11_01865 [Pseudonocardia sp.]
MNPRPDKTHRPTTRLRQLLVTLAAILTLGIITAGPALAFTPVDIVHAEQVKAGPYTLTVGFSVWPIRAMQSLDFTFAPDGGIAGKSGTLTMDGPGVKPDEHVRPLVRHPRKLEVWGLDVKSLNAPGTYTFTFAIDGPQGHGEGTLTGVQVLDQPGPPLGLSWAVSSLPFVGLVAFLVIAWRRTRPRQHTLTL